MYIYFEHVKLTVLLHIVLVLILLFIPAHTRAQNKVIQATIDFSQPVADGSPLIFGGVHNPDIFNDNAWQKIYDAGVTSIRTDFYIERHFPETMTLEDYKNNVNNIQLIENWNQDWISMRRYTYSKAHTMGMVTLGIVSYVPKWLAYNGKTNGVPKDWEVYEDIVKKSYKLYRNDIDILEIWNEPSFIVFLDPEGSGLTVADAYKQIFFHAAKAIKEADMEINDGKITPLGGPVVDYPYQSSLLSSLITDPIASENLSFVTYHNYGNPEPSINVFVNTFIEQQKSPLPIMITEWNNSADYNTFNAKNSGPEAIAYTGQKIINFMLQNVVGANYFILTESRGEGYPGMYTNTNQQVELLPQAKTWQLLSIRLLLGKTISSIYAVDQTADVSTSKLPCLGFSHDSYSGLTCANETNFEYEIHFQFVNTPQALTLRKFIADSSHDGLQQISSIPYNELDTMVTIPPHSVVGLILQ